MELDQPIIKAGDPGGKSNLRLEVIEVNRISSQKLEILARDFKRGQNLIDKESDDADSNANNTLKKVLIEGVWTSNKIFKNSVIHLVNPEFEPATSVYSINNSTGFLVTEPDNLLTCTLVASSLFCERKTWLNSVFLGQIGTNRAMLVGTLVHEVFQYGVKNRLADSDKLIKHLDELLDDASVMLEIYSVELHLKDIRTEAISYVSSVKEWVEKYMFSGQCLGYPRFPLTNDPDLEVKIIGITDIEENVWSTKYGLKGKIDVTGSVRLYDKRTKTVKDKTIPLELKTGNPNLSASHAAQVSLYSMMIEDRYSETNQGFVIYLKNKAAMHNVTLTHNIKRDLIQRRNQINYHMKNYFLGPDMIDQTRMCKGCERLTECVLMSNLYQPGKIEEFPVMKTLEAEAIGHLDDKFLAFFRRYHEKLATMMSNSATSIDVNGDSNQIKSNGSFWTWSSDEAESKGTGFGRLQASVPEGKANSGFIMFKRHPKHKSIVSSCDTGCIEIVDEDGGSSDGEMKQPASKKLKIQDYFQPAFRPNNSKFSPSKAKPFDTKLNFSRCRLAISLDDDGQNMDSQNSSTAIAIGFMNELKEDYFVMKIYEGALDLLKPDLMYRVDKLEKRLPIDIERTVLVRLLAREDWRCDRIRQLLLDSNYEPKDNVKLNLFVLSTCLEEISQLESEQQKFVVHAVSTDNYYILNETIESDKSKVHKIISVLTEVITTLERSLLIVAQNIDSLMNLMKYLQQKRIKFILLDDGKSTRARFQYSGNLVKVVQSETWDLSKKYDAYIKQHESAPVVITTYAMSIGGLLFTRRTFDYCVAYDCDSTELLISLSPMFCSDRHIIIDMREENVASNTELTSSSGTGGGKDTTLSDHLRSLRKVKAVK